MNPPPSLGDNCINDGQHAHSGAAFWNPEFTDGPLCDKHKNEYLREHDMKRKSIGRKYTQPDKRTPAWKEAQAHREAYNRHRTLSGSDPDQ